VVARTVKKGQRRKDRNMKKVALLFVIATLATVGASGCASTRAASAPTVARADACSFTAVSPAARAERREASAAPSAAPIAAAAQGSQIAACLTGFAHANEGGWAQAV
jgi:hypothetical protein